MATEKLYENDESLGNESFVGTRDEHRQVLQRQLEQWYSDYLAELPEDETPMSLEEYIEQALDNGLSEVSS